MNQIEELLLHVKALYRTIEQNHDFFASIVHYTERLNWILAGGIDELTQSELEILAERIEHAFSRWRASPGLQIGAREVEDVDPTVQEINGIVAHLAALDQEEFERILSAAKAAPSIRVRCAANGPGRAGSDCVAVVAGICNRFHLVARQLLARHADRETLSVRDEYDVQDLLHALLTLEFDDIRPEDWSPSYAGSGSRVDFLLKQEQMVIEAKKTRTGLGAREIGEQLMVDIQRYQSHPDCQTLVCFVYDPEGRIANPQGIENDLNGSHDGLDVKVIIAPRGL